MTQESLVRVEVIIFRLTVSDLFTFEDEAVHNFDRIHLPSQLKGVEEDEKGKGKSTDNEFHVRSLFPTHHGMQRNSERSAFCSECNLALDRDCIPGHLEVFESFFLAKSKFVSLSLFEYDTRLCVIASGAFSYSSLQSVLIPNQFELFCTGCPLSIRTKSQAAPFDLQFEVHKKAYE
jgi:hypothetical protein